MDDLQRAVARNMDAREAEAAEALVLVREEVARFQDWMASLDVVPTISALRRRADEVVEQVLRENESRWETLSEKDRERVEIVARAVVSRLLHEPTVRLKDRQAYRDIHTLRELFGLEPVEAEVIQLRDQTRHAR
jgi:glutamyl-tRNA reductase